MDDCDHSVEMWRGVVFCDTTLEVTCMHDDMKTEEVQVSLLAYREMCQLFAASGCLDVD